MNIELYDEHHRENAYSNIKLYSIEEVNGGNPLNPPQIVVVTKSVIILLEQVNIPNPFFIFLGKKT
jgi:hypothetical protein